MVTPAFYVMKWKWQAFSARDKFLVVSKRYLDCTLDNQRKAVRDAKSAVTNILLLKTYQKWFLCYHLSCSFKIFINLLLFCI